MPQYNAKTLNYKSAGAGAINYGVTANNWIPRLENLWTQRTNNAGGSRSFYNKIYNWASPEQITARGGNPNDAQWQYFQDYFRTGKVDPRLKPRLGATALDLGYRENARQQQTKKGFFDSAFGKILKFGLPVAAGAFLPGLIPGLTAGWAGAGAGALMGGLSGGWDDALLGGLGGYGSGSLGGALGNAAGATGGWASSFANPGDFVHNLWNGGPGAITSGSAIPNGVSSGASAGNWFGNALGGGSTAGSLGTGGGGMSNWFTDAIGNYARNNLIGDAIGTGISYFGQRSNQNNLEDAANRLSAGMQFNPYNVNTPYGTAAFSGNNATANLSPEFQRALAEAQGQRVQLGKDAMGFNTSKFANDYYRDVKRMRAPFDAMEQNDFADKVYASGNWGSTVGAQDMFSFDNSRRLADVGMRLDARSQAGQEQQRLFNLYSNALTNELRVAGIPNAQIALGGNLGGAAANAGQAAGQYPWLAATSAMGASNAFWNSLATGVGRGVNSAINKYGGYGSTGSVNRNMGTMWDPNTGYMTEVPVA
jgi:hypothetical protein